MNLLSSSITARRSVLALCGVTLGLLQWGCASTPAGEPVHDKDRLQSFLATKDGRKVVIAGEKYHYVIDGDPSLATLLRWDGRAKLSPDVLGEFKIGRDQHLEGQYVLMAFNADLSPEDQAFLVQSGFARTDVKYGDRTGAALRYFGSVKGRRYAAGELKSDETVDFSRSRYLNYVEQETASAPAEKVEPTPLARAADGALVLDGAPLAVVQGGTDYTCRFRWGLMDFCFFR